MKKKDASKKAPAKKVARKVPVSRGNTPVEPLPDGKLSPDEMDELTSLRMENQELRRELFRSNSPKPHPERVQMTPEEGHIVFSGPKEIGDRVLKYSKQLQIDECVKELRVRLAHARNECTRLEAEILVHDHTLTTGAY